jgi:uncharacterized protein DUF6064
MDLPFTPAQFFDIFAAYNRALWFAVAGLWVAAAAVVTATWRKPDRSALLTYFLSAIRAWNAVAYHAALFTRINPAAWLFAAIFALEAVLLLRAGRRERLDYFSASGVRMWIGCSLILYSLAYPFLSAISHPYPATPTFGVPCPTTILTIGAFLTLRGSVPVLLGIVPAAWGFIGGSAAALLGVPTDYVLLGASVLFVLDGARLAWTRPALSPRA